MTFLSTTRIHTATLWEVDDVDSAGDPSFSPASPRTVSVRWEQREEVFRGASGEELRAGHVVWLGEDVNVGDFLYLGTSTQAVPTDQPGALSVQDFRRVESLGGQLVDRRALL